MRISHWSWIPVVLALSLASFAEAREKDLSHLLPGPVQLQKGGSCHVFSAVALFEANCYRRTGRRVDLSEAALFLRHLEEVWEDPSPETQTITTREKRGNTIHITHTTYHNPHAAKPLIPQNPLEFTGVDGGDSKDTLKRILSCNSCYREQDLPFDARLIADIREIVRKYGEAEADELNAAYRDYTDRKISSEHAAERQQQARKRARARAVAELNARFGDFLNGTVAKDPDIQSCARQGMKLSDLGSVGPSELKRRLDQGLPVLCSLNMTYENADGTRSTGDHALLLMGYRETASGKTEFLFRDSNRRELSWNASLTNCFQALVLD